MKFSMVSFMGVNMGPAPEAIPRLTASQRLEWLLLAACASLADRKADERAPVAAECLLSGLTGKLE